MSVQMILYLSSRQETERDRGRGIHSFWDQSFLWSSSLTHTHTTQNHSNRQFSSFPSHTHTHTHNA